MNKHENSIVNVNRRGWLFNLLTLPFIASILPPKANANTSSNINTHTSRVIVVDRIENIKNISFNFENETCYFSTNSNPFQDGYFVAIRNTDYKDDGGVFFRINESYGWLRVFSGNVQAQWFGVQSQNTECGKEIVRAIKYIAHNGGVLEFSAGYYFIGEQRISLVKDDIKNSFTIVGNGEKTIFAFGNIDPVTNHDGKLIKEPVLFSFIGTDSDDYLPCIILKDFSIDYSNQKNKGGHSLNELDLTHPSPFSVGTNAIYFYYAYLPTIENVYINEVYGNGIVIKKCFFPKVRNCKGNNVSAGNVVSPDGNMAKDSDGGFCFLWSCFSGIVENCIVWNKRVYKSKFSSLDNQTEMQGTICGYIGIWAEYSLTRDNDVPPPRLNWLKNKDLISDTLSSGIVFRNNVVYGYTIGIKTESYVDAIIDGNVVLNCYLPIFASGTRCTISSNWVDMLQCSGIKCPQGGLEFKRSCLGGATWAENNDTNMSLLIEKNYVKSDMYPVFLANRNNLVVKNNYFLTTKKGKLFDSKDNKIVTGLALIENTFVIDEAYEGSSSHITYNANVKLFGNTFINKSLNPCEIALGNDGAHSFIFRNNIFSGFFQLLSNSHICFDENEVSMSKVAKPFIVTKSSGVKFKGNNFYFGELSNVAIFDITSNNVDIVSNVIQSAQVTGPGTPLLFNFSSDSIYNISLQKTEVNINGKEVFLAKFKDVHLLHLAKNTSNIPLNVDISGKGYGPFYMVGNSFKTIQGIDGYNPNDMNNISPLYTASVGEVLYSLKPEIGSDIGIIYTANGWHKIGKLH